ncbi:LysR substrate-binding domain-containing protein, partial [Leucobacter chromiiresistens]
RFTVSQVSTMVALVGAGTGVALVPESAATLGIAGVTYAPLVTSEPRPIELHAVWREDDTRPLTRRIVHELREAAEAQ